MNPIQPLNLPKTQLNLTRKDNEILVLCLVRKKRILLTPEEWVRQHFIAFLTVQLGHPIARISVEKSLDYFGIKKRWDIVVFNQDFTPEILIECKAPNIALNENVLLQALNYQNKLSCKFIGLTNGISHAFWHIDNEKLVFNQLDNLSSLIHR